MHAGARSAGMTTLVLPILDADDAVQHWRIDHDWSARALPIDAITRESLLFEKSDWGRRFEHWALLDWELAAVQAPVASRWAFELDSS